ncbi:MAG: FAD-binding oxidoreductase [Candidatus Hodarchaeota archaeon]
MSKIKSLYDESKVKSVYKEIEDIVGSDYITDKDFMKAAYSRNVDPAFPDRWADMIVRPETTEEISGIVKVANKYKIHMVPRGGGADLVGGSVTQSGILLDLTRINQIYEVSETNFYAVVGCGITWAILVSELEKKGLTTGVVGPGSGYSATIGGGLSNSTAGFGSTKYGLVPDICLGVEVVLPNPQGTILKTGAAGSKYAQPFCRYGLSPDFTGLFMGDVGTLGIKSKAFLKLFPNAPYKTRRDFMLKKDDYEKVTELMHRLQAEIREGLTDLLIVPSIIVDLKSMVPKERTPSKKPEITGPVFQVGLEAFDERILDIYIEKAGEIMKNDSRPFEWNEVDLAEPLAKDFEFNLKYAFNYFNQYISPSPPLVACTTCHKVPISHISEAKRKAEEYVVIAEEKFGVGMAGMFATVIFTLPNGHCVIVGGLSGENVDEKRQLAMDAWHSKIRNQVKYGGIHYWLGESISQSIVEADAYTPDFVQFFKDIKKAVDPNFLLSPKKFHLYSYTDDYTKYIVKDD